MKLKNIPEISSDRFTYKDRVFVTEASDVFGINDGRVLPARIYDDACDIGFYVVSKRTGKKILFVDSGPVLDDEGELIMWTYSSYCLSENPRDLLDLKIHVFND